ncbi:GldG family protein [Alteromonas sp. a30]|uniref:GldG family protein n=1 Tax=Alteromonas sp. a30 TaxID=2730917 RepID=UPI00227F90F0|nr:Gldg family protein [Alteromonas sp. a30]MCY7295986.1 ABC transporter [Alteromonas sp. a30]
MNKRFSTPIAMLLLAVLFFVSVLLSQRLFQPLRVDLTEDQVYSLSDGSKSILQHIDEPIHLYFFFSEQASEGATTLRNYATRVENLLKEYESASDGMLKLHWIDPEPFSEAEDQAVDFGLTGAALAAENDAIYFGLAARNALDDQQVIPFFDPQKERFLEYDISQMIYQLSNAKPVKVGLLSGLSVSGGQNPMTGQFDPPWHFYSQLQSLYDVETLPSNASELPEALDVLLLIHPRSLSEEMRYAIDQFVLSGGKLVAFFDPHHESDPMLPMASSGANVSAGEDAQALEQMLAAWGINLDLEQIVLDPATGLELNTQMGPLKHLGVLGLSRDLIDQNDVVSANLEVINGASFASMMLSEDSQLTMLPLMHSSELGSLAQGSEYAAVQDPNNLSDLLSQNTETRTLAARFSGPATSAFVESPETELAEHTNQGDINVVLVGDSDLLADHFWVSQSRLFDQTIYTAFADNGSLLTNLVENMGGSSALISIRGRGTYSRPFTKVDDLMLEAQMKFQEQEAILEERLFETESVLSELEAKQTEDGRLVLSDEQTQAIEKFNKERIAIRKELRDVRHQLDKDIEKLGSLLKFANIAIAPIFLVLLLMLVMRAKRVTARQFRE